MDALNDPAPPLAPCALLTPARRRLLAEFLRFGVVGTLGFCVDAGTVYATRHWLGLIAAGFLSYFVAASVNWILNRVWTFRHASPAALHRQWMMFLAANAVGLVLNRGTYVALIATVPVFHAWPVLAVAAGSVAGLASNFHLSRRLVFR